MSLEDKIDIAERLRWLRDALCVTQQVMAQRYAGLADHNAWSQYENAVNRINLDTAMRLQSTTGVSINWIYTGGDFDKIPDELQRRIKQQMKLNPHPYEKKRASRRGKPVPGPAR